MGGLPENFISAFEYTDGNRLVVQLVNYDYKWDTDFTNAAIPMELVLTLPESMAGAELWATFYAPEGASRALGFSVWGFLEILVSR